MEKKYQVIKSMNDANRLLELGNTIKKIDRDRNNKDFLIFLFKNTDKLQNDLKFVTENIRYYK